MDALVKTWDSLARERDVITRERDILLRIENGSKERYYELVEEVETLRVERERLENQVSGLTWTNHSLADQCTRLRKDNTVSKQMQPETGWGWSWGDRERKT